jgi:murein DD-endopeptidase MepM/ murein hydrolase activator NlpD
MSKNKVNKLTVLIFLAIGIISISCNQSKTRSSDNIETVEAAIPQTAYGIIVDSMIVYKDKVKKNQFLADILLTHNVDYPTIDLLVKRSKNIFDVRKIRRGNNYTVLCSNDSIQKAQYFVYEKSATEYVVFDLRDSVHVHMGEKEIEREISTASGVISSSLWNAMIENETDPNLANELSDVYAWAIDFFGIQKGDSYKVIYEKLMVEGSYIGIGKIKAALFNHSDQDYYSFYFVGDSTGDFFDDEGQSMRRTFLKAPLHFRRISSGFSYNRLHPVLKKRMPHTGIDYAAAAGTPVVSVGDGKVIFARYKGPNGNMVKIKHNGTYTTAYLHLSKYGKGIKEGVHVKQGQVIGYVGSTGRSTGPHLDFRFYRNGQPINPLKVKSPPAKPVDPIHMDAFMKLKEDYSLQLDKIDIMQPKEIAKSGK